jgi:hypothetical protein
MRDSVAVESPRIAAVPMSRAAEPATFGRRAVLLGAAGALVHRRARAEAPNVPIRLQAELLGKVAGYDRNFEARSGEQARILIVVAPGNSDSKLTATDMRSALGSIPTVGGLSHDEEIVSYVDAPSLAETCRARQVAIVYLTPGFSGEIPAIRDALGALKLLTVGCMADYVPAGIVLGFDLVSGRPKLVVNLSQARRQHVDFRAEVLKLMKVYE